MALSAQASTALSDPTNLSPERTICAEAILAAVLYADLFDFPLALDEIYQFQVGTSFSKEEIAAALETDDSLSSALTRRNSYYSLRGREGVFALRSTRRAESRKLWPRARLYARIASRLPFVRLVAVTGALAVDNLGARPDIDLLVVTSAGRVWVCRRLLILLVRLSRIMGYELCPNYIISEEKLELDQRDFFTAHELAQMVPLFGQNVYRRMIGSNDWAIAYLPCALKPEVLPLHLLRNIRKPFLGERLLGHVAFNKWENWEFTRMQRHLRPLLGRAAEVVCTTDQCKGHTGLHRQSVLAKYADVLNAWELHRALSVVEQDISVSNK